MLFFFHALTAPDQTSQMRRRFLLFCHRLKQMAKPAGTSIREIPSALGAFGNVLNVTSKVQEKALGRRGAKTAKNRSVRALKHE